MNKVQKKKVLEECKKAYIKCIISLNELYTSKGGDSGEFFDYLDIPTSTMEDCTKELINRTIKSTASLALSVKELEDIAKAKKTDVNHSINVPENIEEEDR